MSRCMSCGHDPETDETWHDLARRGWEARKARGVYMGGGKPFGFAWNEATQRWETVESEHHTLVEMRRLRANGLGYNAIATELNRRGIPTPKGGTQWRAPAVRAILLNPFYERLRVVA